MKEIRASGKAYCPHCKGYHPTCVMCKEKQKASKDMAKTIRDYNRSQDERGKEVK